MQKQNNIVICRLRKFMSRCEIAAVWCGDRRMKTEGGGAGEGWSGGGGAGCAMNRLAPQSCLGSLPAEKTIQPVLISSWSFITTTVEPV